MLPRADTLYDRYGVYKLARKRQIASQFFAAYLFENGLDFIKAPSDCGKRYSTRGNTGGLLCVLGMISRPPQCPV